MAKTTTNEHDNKVFVINKADGPTSFAVVSALRRAVGLRKVLTRRQTNHVMKTLKDGEVTTYDDWKGRFQANSEKMRTGDIIAAVNQEPVTTWHDLKEALTQAGGKPVSLSVLRQSRSVLSVLTEASPGSVSPPLRYGC